MTMLLIFILAIGCAVYWFKLRADSIESDSEDMVEPGSRQPYGNQFWSMISRKSD